MEAAAARVASIPKRHLEELARFTNPPPAVQNTLTAVHLLLEASEQSDKPAAAQKLGLRSAMQAASMVSLPAVGRELARAGRESSRTHASDVWEGSEKMSPLLSLALTLRLKSLRYTVTPSTSGSARATTSTESLNRIPLALNSEMVVASEALRAA